jgi:hypothetical protein
MVFLGSTSPRARRRAWWLAGLLGLGGAFAALAFVLPQGGAFPDTTRPGRADVVHVPRAVPLTPERRRVINSLLDAFIPSAVERHEPLRALPLVTPVLRTGITRHDWAQGKLPVIPYDAEGTKFRGWTVNYSLAREMSVDVLLRPGPREQRGAIAFTAVFKRPRMTWLIDEFVPAASFAPDDAPTKRILAQPDYAPTNGNSGR